MKHMSMICIAIGLTSVLHAQEFAVRWAPVQFTYSEEQEVALSATLGESIVGVDEHPETILVQGFYNGPYGMGSVGIFRLPEILTGITAFPNPAQSRVMLHNEDAGQEQYKVMLLDTGGKPRVLPNWPPAMVTYPVELDAHPAGTYVIVVGEVNTGRMAILKIVKH